MILKAAGAVPVLRKRILTVSTPSLRLHSMNSATTPASLVSCTWSGSAGFVAGLVVFGPGTTPGAPRATPSVAPALRDSFSAWTLPPLDFSRFVPNSSGTAAGRPRRRRAHILGGVVEQGAGVEGDAARRRIAVRAQLPRLQAETGGAPPLDAPGLPGVVGVHPAGEGDLGFSAEGPVAGAAADAGPTLGSDADADAPRAPSDPAAKRHALVALTS